MKHKAPPMSAAPLHYWYDGTSTGVAMRATDKGRYAGLVSMVQGDRRDALIFARLLKAKHIRNAYVGLPEACSPSPRTV